jgi:hypothetical protein
MGRLVSDELVKGNEMAVKIKFQSSRETRVAVQVRRPKWQEYLNY